MAGTFQKIPERQMAETFQKIPERHMAGAGDGCRIFLRQTAFLTSETPRFSTYIFESYNTGQVPL